LRINSRKRSGLSSVVAAAFMFIIVSGALTVTLWSTRQQDNVTNELLEKTRQMLGSLNEEIDVEEVSVVNNKLNVTLSNNGGASTRVNSIYIVNETASPKEQFRYDISYVVDGRGVVTNVGQTLPFVADDTTSYSVKVVTESGSSASGDFLPVALTPLPMSLYVIPPTVTTGEEITVLYAITNNITDSDSPLTISPVITSSISCQVSQACSLTEVEAAPSSVVIHKGSTTLIKKVYQANGPPDTSLTFNASYTGAVQGNYVIEQGTIIVVDLAQSVITSIATAPDIYLMLPGPFGTSATNDQQGLWGAVVVNPTSSPMTVSRVLMTAFTAAHDSNTQIVSGPPNPACPNTPINPASGWSCPHDNQIMWADLDQPQTLAANETRTFLVKVKPTSISGTEEPGVTVTATVYTDVGVFTRTGYTVGLTQVNQPLGNVYLTTTDNTNTAIQPHALENANIRGHLNNLAPNTNTTFYVAMVDLDTSAVTYIDQGARLIINIPPGFGNVTINSDDKFGTTSITVRADGITQIIGTTDQDIGDAASGEAAVISFYALTPSPAISTTYLMFAFIDGETTGAQLGSDFSAGAIAETALQVNET
jgi:hypothetical protein